MGRQTSIAKSVAAPLRHGGRKRPTTKLGRIIAAFSLLFSLYQLPFEKIHPEVFGNLRKNHWQVKDEEYEESFEPVPEDGDQKSDIALHAIGDMGFSGSV